MPWKGGEHRFCFLKPWRLSLFLFWNLLWSAPKLCPWQSYTKITVFVLSITEVRGGRWVGGQVHFIRVSVHPSREWFGLEAWIGLLILMCSLHRAFGIVLNSSLITEPCRPSPTFKTFFSFVYLVESFIIFFLLSAKSLKLRNFYKVTLLINSFAYPKLSTNCRHEKGKLLNIINHLIDLFVSMLLLV